MSYVIMYGNVLNRAKQSGTWATARVKDYLNKAQGVIWRKAKEWKVLEQQDTSTGVVGQENYSLPDDFERPISVQLETGTNYYNVTEKSYDTVRQSLNVNTNNGRPYYYCIHYQELLFSQELDAAYTIRLDYIGQASTLSDDADTPRLERRRIGEDPEGHSALCSPARQAPPRRVADSGGWATKLDLVRGPDHAGRTYGQGTNGTGIQGTACPRRIPNRSSGRRRFQHVHP